MRNKLCLRAMVRNYRSIVCSIIHDGTISAWPVSYSELLRSHILWMLLGNVHDVCSIRSKAHSALGWALCWISSLHISSLHRFVKSLDSLLHRAFLSSSFALLLRFRRSLNEISRLRSRIVEAVLCVKHLAFCQLSSSCLCKEGLGALFFSQGFLNFFLFLRRH